MELPRQADYSLTPEQEALSEGFAAFFAKECPSSRVRAAEPGGFDPELWSRLSGLRPVAMAVPEDAGGDGAGLVEAVLVAEELGRSAAPIPLIESIVAARLLSRLSEPPGDWLPELMSGQRIATVALHRGPGRQLVPAAAVADAVLGLYRGDLILTPQLVRPARVPNQGFAPLAWWDPADATATSSIVPAGTAPREHWDAAVREWKLLVAAAMVGMARAALAVGVDHARSRVAFGAPIGSFQAVSHALADVAMNAATARRLVLKSAWFEDYERGRRPELLPMAYLYAEQTAMQATTVGVHVLGGVGFTVEADQQMYFRRVKGWSLVAGDPKRELDTIARHLLGAVTAGVQEP